MDTMVYHLYLSRRVSRRTTYEGNIQAYNTGTAFETHWCGTAEQQHRLKSNYQNTDNAAFFETFSFVIYRGMYSSRAFDCTPC
jgi:hypothetical protein